MGGGWVEVENSSGVQVIDCMTQEKWHTRVENLDNTGYYDTFIAIIKEMTRHDKRYDEVMKMS